MEKKEYTKVLTKEKLGSHIKNAEYAIRGYIVQLADELAGRMKAGEKMPFAKFFPCNIGNPLSLGQPTASFEREVLAVAMCPALLDAPSISADAKERAKLYMSRVEYPQALGAYTASAGMPVVLESVRKFIEERDGFPADPANIFLMNGASDGVTTLFNVMISGPKDAVSGSTMSRSWCRSLSTRSTAL
jgi:alanine transaminase